MKKIISFIACMLFVSSVFALRFGIDYLPMYFEKDIINKCENATVQLSAPSDDDFNSAWHSNLIKNDEEFYKRAKSWRICTKDNLVTIAKEEAKKGALLIHYKDNLYYIAVLEN